MHPSIGKLWANYIFSIFGLEVGGSGINGSGVDDCQAVQALLT
jgi:hypothetical protein